jgi:alkylhydroperoxidase/carboxymuconolactone decarboxylase family protein YurZ
MSGFKKGREDKLFNIESTAFLKIACLVATDVLLQFEWHINKELKGGCTVNEIREVLSAATYCDTQTIASVLQAAAVAFKISRH